MVLIAMRIWGLIWYQVRPWSSKSILDIVMVMGIGIQAEPNQRSGSV